MCRQAKPLTHKLIQSIKVTEKEKLLCDGNNLYLRIRPNGSKHWAFIYTHPILKTKKSMGLGSYKFVSLSIARNIALEAKKLLVSGIDPVEHKKETELLTKIALETTFETVAQEWLEKKKNDVKKKHIYRTQRLLINHLYPSLKNTPISQITSSRLINALSKAEQKGIFSTIQRLCQIVNEIMNYAECHSFIPYGSNSINITKKYFKKPKVENFPTLKPEELSQLISDIHNATCTDITKNLLFWELHSLSRPGEAATAEWQHIDLVKKQWIIPANIMKNEREHIVPLTPETIEILHKMQPISGQERYVFPSARKKNHHINKQMANAALKRMGYKGRVM